MRARGVRVKAHWEFFVVLFEPAYNLHGTDLAKATFVIKDDGHVRNSVPHFEQF